jgi:hypothetical protein
LERLLQKAGTGETVYIQRRGRIFILQEISANESIPMRPPGYFEGCYSKAEILQMNGFAKASVVKAPTDLE